MESACNHFYERTGAKVLIGALHMTEEALENYLLSQKSKNEREPYEGI